VTARAAITLVVLAGVVTLAAAQGGNGPSSVVTTQRFDDYVKAHAKQHELEAQAVDLAKQAIDIRLGMMNELRAQINTERGSYQSAGEAKIQMSSVELRLRALEQAQAAQAGSNVTWAAAIAAFIVIVQIALQYFPHGLNGRGRNQ